MNIYQGNFFYEPQLLIQKSKNLRKYEAVFNQIDFTGFPVRKYNKGRKGYSNHAILRALVFKHLERISSIPMLLDRLDENPVLREMCGFDDLPNSSKFYRFIKETPNSRIQGVMQRTVKKLLDDGKLSGKLLIADSKPILARTKENNLKNPSRKIGKKQGPPKRNPQATYHYYSYQKIYDGSKEVKKFSFFWGYRTHVIVNEHGIVLVETTESNNRTDAQVAKKLLKKLKRLYGSIKGSPPSSS